MTPEALQSRRMSVRRVGASAAVTAKRLNQPAVGLNTCPLHEMISTGGCTVTRCSISEHVETTFLPAPSVVVTIRHPSLV